MKAQRSKQVYVSSVSKDTKISNVYVGRQDGLKDVDKINVLPGQPDGLNFNQFSGYVTVDPGAGRALFYYFVESEKNSDAKPLVLWLNGGPGCSSFGNGAMLELGPFRVNPDGKTLSYNQYAWNKVANILFLESPAGVGFSYSNTTSDYDHSGDSQTADDNYTFLINWLERFPEYKNRDFFITGESYAGHYIPQLAQKILQNNKNTNYTVIKLQGIAMGNALIDSETSYRGMYDFFWTHALISDEVHEGITSSCNFSSPKNSEDCDHYDGEVGKHLSNIDIYNIYAPLCLSNKTQRDYCGFDPCSENYVDFYLNTPQVQKSLHANVTRIPYRWQSCSGTISQAWNDSPLTVLPTIQRLMAKGIYVCLYSGDVDGRVPVTSTKYAIEQLQKTYHISVQTPWNHWYTDGEVGGYAVGYQQNLTFVTVRGAGHYVPSNQPARALALFSSFLNGKIPSQ
ncbi:hypothetical protein DITRI_Ditri01bG0060700 [Diplodiscus trichospermus]